MENSWHKLSSAFNYLVMSLNSERPDTSLSRSKRGTVNNFTGKQEQTQKQVKAGLSQAEQGDQGQGGTLLGKGH